MFKDQHDLTVTQAPLHIKRKYVSQLFFIRSLKFYSQTQHMLHVWRTQWIPKMFLALKIGTLHLLASLKGAQTPGAE
jgi:hypothetical protein